MRPRIAQKLQRNAPIVWRLSWPAKGIPVERLHGISFTMQGDVGVDVNNEEMGRISKLMNGPLPLVLVNGRAQTNPSLEAVMAEIYRARKH